MRLLPPALPFWTPYFRETLESSFSSVSKPIFATKMSFCSIFRDLQDLHSFAPVETQNCCKNSHENLLIFRKKINIFLSNSSFFALVLMKIHRNFNNFPKIVKNIRDFIHFNAFGVGGLRKMAK